MNWEILLFLACWRKSYADIKLLHHFDQVKSNQHLSNSDAAPPHNPSMFLGLRFVAELLSESYLFLIIHLRNKSSLDQDQTRQTDVELDFFFKAEGQFVVCNDFQKWGIFAVCLLLGSQYVL